MTQRNFLFKLSAVGLLSLFVSGAYASGYKMEFQSASVLADAGEAAVVEDAGTNWYNSAGLTRLPRQLVFSGIDVYAPVTVTGTANAPSIVNMVAPGFGTNFNASGSASAHSNAFLPAFHVSWPVSDRVALGLSVAPAWGFMEDYGDNSLVRYNLMRVYTRTIDLAPSIAFKINNQWSVGLGPDAHYFYVSSQSRVRSEGIAPPVVGTFNDSTARFASNSWNYGAHIGVLFSTQDDHTRVGLNYRTRITQDTSGQSTYLTDPDSSSLFYLTDLFKLKVALPPVTTFSVYHDMAPCWALMGTIAYDQWSTIQRYVGRNYILADGSIDPAIPQIQDMRNTIDLSVGTHYWVSPKWMLRASFKYEPTPTRNEYRGVNFPDGTKYGLNIGTRYQWTKRLAIDLIYGHVFVPSMHINDLNPSSQATFVGHTNSSVDVLGGQVVWDI